MRIVALFLILFTFWNCKSGNKNNLPSTNNVDLSDTIHPKSNYDSLVIKNNEILPFSHKVKQITAYAYKKEGEKFNLFFDVTTQTKAFVKIITDDKAANIRINQVITPDQKSDGPFGKDVEFPLYQGGMYQIVIAENLMQGNPFQGNFKIEIELK